MTDLLADWISALSCLKGPLDPHSIASIIENTTLRWSSTTETGVNIAWITYKPAEGFTGKPRRCVVLINPRIEPLYQVERVEALMRVSLRCWQYYMSFNDLRIEPFYAALGVVQSPLYDPRVRWQRLSMKYHRGEVAASRFESRPLCPVCKIHVSTGHINPKIHDGCREYVRNVYAPALKAQTQEQSARPT
jgi:hypothetical protein